MTTLAPALSIVRCKWCGKPQRFRIEAPARGSFRCDDRGCGIEQAFVLDSNK